jgi:hypothetical protein
MFPTSKKLQELDKKQKEADKLYEQEKEKIIEVYVDARKKLEDEHSDNLRIVKEKYYPEFDNLRGEATMLRGILAERDRLASDIYKRVVSELKDIQPSDLLLEYNNSVQAANSFCSSKFNMPLSDFE